MANKKKSRRKSRKRLRNSIKNSKNANRRRAVRKKLKKDTFNVTDLFKNIDIDPLEDIFESIRITTQHKSNLPTQLACSASNLVPHSSSGLLELAEQ